MHGLAAVLMSLVVANTDADSALIEFDFQLTPIMDKPKIERYEFLAYFSAVSEILKLNLDESTGLIFRVKLIKDI